MRLRAMVRMGLKGLYLRLIGLLGVLAMALESTAPHRGMRAARVTSAQCGWSEYRSVDLVNRGYQGSICWSGKKVGRLLLPPPTFRPTFPICPNMFRQEMRESM